MYYRRKLTVIFTWRKRVPKYIPNIGNMLALSKDPCRWVKDIVSRIDDMVPINEEELSKNRKQIAVELRTSKY